MKKWVSLIVASVNTIILSLVITTSVYAQGPTPTPIPLPPGGSRESVPINIGDPGFGVKPDTSLGGLLKNVLVIIFTLAAVLVLFMLAWGAFQWITSGGDKEAVDKARKRITASLIGLALLALAYLLAVVVGRLVGIDVLNIDKLPNITGR